MTDEELQQIRERCKAALRWHGCIYSSPIGEIIEQDVPALLQEVARLRHDYKREKLDAVAALERLEAKLRGLADTIDAQDVEIARLRTELTEMNSLRLAAINSENAVCGQRNAAEAEVARLRGDPLNKSSSLRWYLLGDDGILRRMS